MTKLIITLLVIILLAACGQPTEIKEEAAPTPSSVDNVSSSTLSYVSPVFEPDVNSDEEHYFKLIQEILFANIQKLEEQYSIKLMGAGSGSDHLLVMIRKAKTFEQQLSDEEIERIKNTMFEMVGEEFPIKLEVSHCCSQEASISGKITDKEEKQILVIDDVKKNGNSDDPYAVWIELTDDGIIVQSDEEETYSFDELAEGMTVKAWFTGFMDQTYPGQTSALKIEIQ